MGVTYPPYPANADDMAAIRTELLDALRTALAQLGADEWRKLLRVGTIYRTTKLGMSFEAGRSVPIAPTEPPLSFPRMKV